MIRFECDYAEGAHPAVLELLTATNFDQTPGYGEDKYCEEARALIRTLTQSPDADVHFLVGGTQANTIVIASILRPWQGVISAETGHINVHETGAIEATGHKVIALPAHQGKLTAADIRTAVENHRADPNHEHIVQPGMVYLSHPTEAGTLYSRDELTEISTTCRQLGLPLFLDGARLGYGLAARPELTLPDIASLCDVFYIGGTKQGALFGEAVVITNNALKPDFRYSIKQRGGMLAKGRLLGIQFLALLRDGLYFSLAEKAVRQAARIRDAFAAAGYDFYAPSDTNQQFPILPAPIARALEKDFAFCPWETLPDGRMAVRFCTSWATREEDVDALIAAIPKNTK